MIYTVILVAILAFVVTIILIPQIVFMYWYIKGVNAVFPISPVGNLLNVIFKKEPLFISLQHFYGTMKKRGNKFGGYCFLLRPIFVPTDLDLIKRMLINDFDHFTDHIGHVNAENDPISLNLFNTKGYHWQSIRSKLSSSFTSAKTKIMFGTALKYAEDFKQCIDRNEAFDIKEISERFTTDVIVSYGFGIESKALQSGTSEFRRLVSEMVETFRYLLVYSLPELFSLFGIRTFSEEITNFFMKLVEETALYREESGVVREDFIHHLLQIGSHNNITNREIKEMKSKRDISLSLNEMAAQCEIFYVAGFETTAASISFTLAELAINQEIQNKVREEIKVVLKEHKGKVTYEAIMEMQYLDNCLYESLRKYPPLPTNNRVCTKSYKIPNSNVVINEGTYVFLPIYAVHRDPEYFPNPDKFDPDRFSKENTKDRLPLAFLSFGDGPRKCIGSKFGIVQVKVALVVLLNHFKFFLHPDISIPLQFKPTFLLNTVSPLKLIMIYTVVLVAILAFVVTIILIPQIIVFMYWYTKGVNAVFPISPVGNLLNVIFKKEPLFISLQHFYGTMKKRGNKFGGYCFLARPIFVPTDLDLIKRMLINDFDHFTDHIGHVNAENDPISLNLFNTKGYHWQSIRSKLSSSFTSAKTKIMFGTALKYAEDFKQCLDRNEAFDIKDVSERFTTDVIVSYGFGIESKALQSGTSEFRRLVSEMLQSFRFLLVNSLPELFSLFGIRTFSKEITSFFMKLVEETALYREENGVVREDFIHHLLQIGSNNNITNREINETKSKRDIGLSLNEMAAQCEIFYVAGFETTAASISFTLAELALNQEIQNKVREEIKVVLKEHKGKVTYEAIMEMQYLDNCLYESLRKYPPLPTNNRLCTKSYKIPNSNVIINEGTYVFLPIYAVHRDPEYFPNPDKFDPDRFSKENTKNRLPLAFFPFGDGPRKCIGSKFGIVQVKVALVVLLNHFKFFLHPDISIPLQLKSTYLLNTLNPLKLIVKKLEE
ncbi:hypothetical protein RI129_007755 [Pyrocoelia pectoralis]|uniref:Cytochrome P450 n=1 Tax=Pyrocoelia pectoralis TaxID=417401 RepID=A0AAN7ZF67_9COLE